MNAYDASIGGNLVGTTTRFGTGLGNNNFQVLSVNAASIFRVELFQARDISIDGVFVEDFQFAAPVVVPGPGTLTLLTLGLLGSVVVWRRRGVQDVAETRTCHGLAD